MCRDEQTCGGFEKFLPNQPLNHRITAAQDGGEACKHVVAIDSEASGADQAPRRGLAALQQGAGKTGLQFQKAIAVS